MVALDLDHLAGQSIEHEPDGLSGYLPRFAKSSWVQITDHYSIAGDVLNFFYSSCLVCCS